MLYLHDVWVNWFEGEENGYNVSEFHEWRKDDVVELLDQVPLLKVSDELYDYIENDMDSLPRELLNTVHKKAFLRKNHARVQLDYAFVITNGIDALAVDTVGLEMPIKKSRLIPRQFQLVHEMINEETKEFTYKVELKRNKEYHLLSPKPEFMIGLTRREKQLKQLLLMVIDDIKAEKHLEKLKYLCTEISPSNYKNLNNMDFDELFDKFVEVASHGWSDAHEAVLKVGIKGKSFFEKIYEMENVIKVS